MTNQTLPAYAPLVQRTRGSRIESVHFAALAVVDRTGQLLLSVGDPMTTTFMRSSAKPFQALPFVAENGPERLGFDEADLALICASHGGRPEHTRRVAAMLARLGLEPTALQCGVHAPLDPEAARALACQHAEPTPLHHNCSGKHTGMLARAYLHRWDLASYLDPSHPVQRDIRAVLARFANLPVEAIELGTDGCSAPNFALPLYHAAWAWARLVDPQDVAEPWATAARRVVRAMTGHPEMVGGPGRLDTVLMQHLGGAVVVKGGADGYQAMGIAAGIWPHAKGGVGVALKIADGDRGSFARGRVLVALLQRIGLLATSLPAALQAWDPRGAVTNWRGLRVGQHEVLL